MQKSAIELLIEGYDQTEKETLEAQSLEQEGAIQKDKPEERQLTAIELLMAGYNPNSTQKETEVTVNPNEIKGEEK